MISSVFGRFSTRRFQCRYFWHRHTATLCASYYESKFPTLNFQKVRIFLRHGRSTTAVPYAVSTRPEPFDFVYTRGLRYKLNKPQSMCVHIRQCAFVHLPTFPAEARLRIYAATVTPQPCPTINQPGINRRKEAGSKMYQVMFFRVHNASMCRSSI